MTSFSHTAQLELTVSARYPLKPWLHRPECDTRVQAGLEAARPLVKWLGDYVGPSTRPREQR